MQTHRRDLNDLLTFYSFTPLQDPFISADSSKNQRQKKSGKRCLVLNLASDSSCFLWYCELFTPIQPQGPAQIPRV